jgi:predicted phosphodiesterase
VRVAALNDIHGNLPALEAVLAEVDHEGVDTIVCGGDVVPGPFPAEVFDRLTALPNVQFLRGNADRFLIEGVGEYGQDWVADRQRVGDARLAAIASWPLTVELDVDGLGRTLFFHAVPTADEPIFTRITPDEEVIDLIGDVDVDLAVCGHTHVQFDRRLSNCLRVVNAGSVGMPYEGRRGAFWCLLGPIVQHRHTEYDVEAAAESIRALGSPTHEQLIGWLLEPPDPVETSSFFEEQRKKASGA